MQPGPHIPTLTKHKGLPVVGVLPELLANSPLRTLSLIMVRDGGFVKLQLGTKPVYLVSDPAIFRHVFETRAKRGLNSQW